MCPHKRMSLIFPILFMSFLNQPIQAYASGLLVVDRQRPRGYTQVVVGADRYYYNEGIFYTGGPGSYVVVGAPLGAVIYDIPSSYQRVYIDDEVYFVYHDVYYRPYGRGYVVVERPPHWRHRDDDDRWRGGEERHEHWD